MNLAMRTAAPGLRALAREGAVSEAGDHRGYQRFLADVEGDYLTALRHLMSCPVCERMTRMLLLGFLPPAAPPAGRSTPARGENGVSGEEA